MVQFPPEGSCDCHVHVIGPKERFPLSPERAYTPPDAPLQALQTMLDELGVHRVVLVQPSIYGTDNSCMMSALDRLGQRGRAVAVLPPTTSAGEADQLEAFGIRGLRVNVASRGRRPVEKVKAEIGAAAAIAARNGWHVQLFIEPTSIAELAGFLSALPIPVVLDHFGLLTAEHAGSSEEESVLRLLEGGRTWVKLSAPYRIASDPLEPWVEELARRMVQENPERVVWGSDWPHTPPHKGGIRAGDEEMPYRNISTAGLLAAVGAWISEPRLLHQILVANPEQLYRFG